MSESFNIADIYLKKTEDSYKWQYYAAKSLPLDDETAALCASVIRIYWV